MSSYGCKILVGRTVHEAVTVMTDADRLMSALKGHLRVQAEREVSHASRRWLSCYASVSWQIEAPTWARG